MDPNTDQQLADLLRRAQEGDRVSYERFLIETREIVRTVLRSRLRSAAALDDVVQETLLSIHRYRHTYDPARPIGPWIHAIAFNRLRDLARAQRRRRDGGVIEQDWETAMHGGSSDEPAAPALQRAVLSVLSAAQREIIWLMKIEGYSVAEVAQRTGRSPAAVKVTAHRGYRALRALLGGQ